MSARGTGAAVRPRSRSLALGGLVVATVAVALSSAGPAGGSHTPSRLLVTADEWTYVLSQAKLPRGPAIVELRNKGEDPHDLRMRRVGGRKTYKLGRIPPGEGGRVEARLKRGSRYRLWCSLPHHRERGMKSTLKVARKK